MTYSTPELQRVGVAQNLVLGRGKLPGTFDNVDLFGVDDYSDSTISLDDSEW